ncbi:TPA: P-loop NTPase fold protein [Vibrio parahaemolyticus]|nr:AAA family ATPase [Vibrio parahaemolyticus]EIA9325740.1 AAA family ATPase [Vibrio parahaemolyticus]
MELKDSHEFASDRPITRPEEDLLGRANFSSDLADAISSWHGEDSLVVALHGDWGAGKSSIKNMALSKLKKLEGEKPDVIEFSPWEWAAQEKITASFFEEISKSVGQKDKSKSGKKLAATFKRYGRYLNTGEVVVSGLSSALPTLFVLATVVGFGGNFSDTEWVKNTSAILLAVLASWAAVLKWGKSFLGNISGNVEASAKEQEKGLSDIRSDLTALLSNRKSPLIVVMDDLDRLTSSQLRMVFQLIKANLEFPNVVFVLLFQRDIVEEKLTDGKQSGRDYLEKIIQVPFDIPKIEKTKLHNLLFNKLDRILEQDKTISQMFDSRRWGNLFHGALHSYFDNLRSVYRYTSTLSFHFALLKGRSAFEVNPVDLIAIECLRVFEPDVYREISRAKDIFTKNGEGRYEREATSSLIEDIVSKSTDKSRKQVRVIIEQLFPTIEWAFGGTTYSGGFTDSWLQEMRICHPSNFDKYFQFSIPTGELSNSDLQEMLSLTNDSENFCSFIMSLESRGILKNALAQFESFTDKVPLTNGLSYIKALLDIADGVESESTGFTMLSANLHVIRLVVWFLKRIESIEERGQLLIKCFELSKGLSVVEHILVSDENRRKEKESDIILDDKSFDTLKEMFVSKVNQMADKSPELLMSHKHLVSFLYRWQKWGDSQKVTAWLEAQISTLEGSILLLKAFVSKSSSQTMGDYVAQINTYIKLENLESFISVDTIIAVLEGIDKSTLAPDEKEAVDAFQEAVENRTKGITGDNW